MDDFINFYVPGLDGRVFNPLIYLVEYMKQNPTKFRDNVRIKSFYGAFPGTIWNGGRANFGKYFTKDVLEGTIQEANSLDVALRYTYTNSLITKNELNDYYCNKTMEFADNGKNEVLVNNPVLENYLRQRYPNFKYILSTTACVRDLDKINEATEKYDLVVMDFRDNKNEDFLNGIVHKNKIEILVDETCHKDCPYRKKHYEDVARIQLLELGDGEAKCMFEPHYTRNNSFYENFSNNPDTVITADDLYNKYVDMGFRHFKLLGRNNETYFQFESYIHYLVKPEWREQVRSDIFPAFFGLEFPNAR